MWIIWCAIVANGHTISHDSSIYEACIIHVRHDWHTQGCEWPRNARARACTHTHAHTHAYIHTHTYTHSLTRTHRQAHTRTHTHTHTHTPHTHTRTHIHTHPFGAPTLAAVTHSNVWHDSSWLIHMRDTGWRMDTTFRLPRFRGFSKVSVEPPLAPNTYAPPPAPNIPLLCCFQTICFIECVYEYVHIYVYTWVCICVCLYIYIYVDMCICIYTYVYI